MKFVPLAVQLCTIINPVLVALLFVDGLLIKGASKERWRKIFTFWGMAALGVGVAVILAESGKKFEVWEGHPLFPSGHATFAVSAATCFVLQSSLSRAFLVVPLAVLMVICLPFAGFHTWDEVAGGTVLGIAIPLLIWRLVYLARTAPA